MNTTDEYVGIPTEVIGRFKGLRFMVLKDLLELFPFVVVTDDEEAVKMMASMFVFFNVKRTDSGKEIVVFE